METRLDTFNGWQMRASVESRPATGKSRYYIVAPLAYKEFSMAELIHLDDGRNIKNSSFANEEDAFEFAFGICKRAIMDTMSSHRLQSAGQSAPPELDLSSAASDIE
jgi:hypothetical protein